MLNVVEDESEPVRVLGADGDPHLPPSRLEQRQRSRGIGCFSFIFSDSCRLYMIHFHPKVCIEEEEVELTAIAGGANGDDCRSVTTSRMNFIICGRKLHTKLVQCKLLR